MLELSSTTLTEPASIDIFPSRGMWDTHAKAQLAAGFPARHSDWEDSDNNSRHKQLQELHFCSLNSQCTYVDLADLVRSEGNSFLSFFTEFYVSLCQKGKLQLKRLLSNIQSYNFL